MSVQAHNTAPTGLGKSLEPYGQLIRMLLPRAISIDIFDAQGHECWSSSDVESADLQPLVQRARAAQAGCEEGLFAEIDEDTPVYLFRLCDEAGDLLAILAVTCHGDGLTARPWSFVHSLLRPALECLQRDLLAQESIGELSRSLETRDKDLDLLLAITADNAPDSDANGDDTDELRWIVQRSIDHLNCLFGALVIPEKGIAICRAARGVNPAQSAEVLTRTHRHLLTWARLQGKTLVVNKVAPAGGEALPYKILSCPVRQSSNRVVGFFALFRTEDMGDFDHRHTRIARLLSRKTASVLQANYDGATGLLTRGAFERHAQAGIARAGGHEHCVLYIDIDQMHLINENFGMPVGDEVIARVADLARRTPVSRAVAARISGDRFALLLPDCDLEDAAGVARRLCDSVRAAPEAQPDGENPEVSVSIGVANLSGSRSRLAHALAAAEVACKAAKDRGRDRVEVYQAADVSIIRRHTDINVAAQLRDALRANQFRLDLQPILPLQGGSNKDPHFEVLLRMIGSDGGSIAPEKFLSAAARYQLMPAIDRWVVEHALGTLAENRGLLRQHSACFTINIAGPSIAQPDFLDYVQSQIRASGLPADLFCFELTETAAVANMGRAEAFMQQLRNFGCTFALDDFGTGFSSLAYLKALPVTLLKIDGSFVRDVILDSRSQSMVRAIAQLAKTMCMETVAEYVETDEIRRRVAALGVDYGQGFCLGRPQPIVDVLRDLPVFEAFSRSPQRDPSSEAQMVAAMAAG
ncbi:MAG TPA: bifunctional diguanylate cyclase/phosphodiesterase [Steroidobacteraceae bacterium]|nr:bifunctional diguanylate cyclase/phosphodiesterase [Steroidobacteraceae bacterium]